ncbi:MAG: GNAT family N-acetyltransferase [Elusimicrobia bacterium]|nr:GNAT family N-acetyltransferase [Elusimicrobiota bacterium]
MSDPTTVRRARREDTAAIADFQCRLAAETEGLRLDGPTVLRGVRAVFEDPAKGAYWVAERGGRVVGCLLTVPEWSDWRNRAVWWIHSVYVDPKHRRAGVYRSLYAELKRLVEGAEELGGLRLYVDQRNARACGAYEKLGMRRDHYYLYEWLK